MRVRASRIMNLGTNDIISGGAACHTMKIYTKTGDGGNTGLQGNLRIAKSHPRIMAYGAVDESNAAIGVALSHGVDGDIAGILGAIQGDLFVVGADLSNPSLADTRNRVTPGMVLGLEATIDRLEQELEPLSNFILPGGGPAAASIHLARATIRRAETLAVALSETDEINASCIRYLNRLSDLFFILGRVVSKRAGCKETPWRPGKDRL